MKFAWLLPVIGPLAACGGGAGSPPTGVDVTTPAYQTYTTNHNGYSRVRRDYSTSADAAVIAAFEDANPSDPAGYANLTKTIEARYSGKMIIEVLAAVDGTNKPTRILRLTADQSPFHNVSGSSLITNSGQFYFRGAGYAWVNVNGTLTQTSDSTALTNLILNFSSQTATVNFRTSTASGDVKVSVGTADLPFNVVTGAFGGTVSVTVDAGGTAYSVPGQLRGNVGGSPTWAVDPVSGKSLHQMAVSGLFTGTSTAGTPVQVDGAFMGVDPNGF